MNKLEFMNEAGNLADKFASLLCAYTSRHGGYEGETENKTPIIVANISVSIQNGELATIGADIGGADSKHRIKINRYPNTISDEWRVEDK